MKPTSVDYCRPDTIQDALASLRLGDDVTPVSGGQSLLILMRLRLAAPEKLVDVSRIAELTAFQLTAEGIRLGAATPHALIEDGLVPDVTCGLMPFAASGIAYRAVRNVGTIGGSLALADPSADWPLCLLALGGRVLIDGEEGRRSVTMDDFLVSAFTTDLGQGELLTAIDIPALTPGSRWGYVKMARKHGAFADSLCAVVLRKDGASRIALGATMDRARLLRQTMARLEEDPETPEDKLRSALMEDVSEAEPDADAYRHRCHVATALKALRHARMQCA